MRVPFSLSPVLAFAILVSAAPAAAQDYTFSMEDQEVFYDPATGSGEFHVDVIVTEDAANTTFPTPTSAFEVRIVNDPDYMHPTDAVVTDAAIAEVNGGAGPDHVDIDMREDWITVHVFYSHRYETFPLDGPVLSITYELNDTTLAGDATGAETELLFEQLLIDPFDGLQLGNVVVVYTVVPGGLIVLEGSYPEFDHATITLTPGVVEPPLPEDHFRRGDADGNGVVSGLPDAIYLLKWGFAAGDVPPCSDAADVDDNGSVVAISDAVRLLQWSFAGGTEPASPGPETCGDDTTDDALSCETPPAACAP